jgi:hypothetical protein
LRTPFADIHREAMFPVHCAVLGGNLSLLQWLVESQGCPLSMQRDIGLHRKLNSVQTSASRTLLDLAMSGRVRVDILQYLIQHGFSIDDVKDHSLVPKTLEAMLKMGVSLNNSSNNMDPLFANPTLSQIPHVIDEDGMDVDLEDCQQEDSETNLDDACALCCERSMDCVLIPCGHQICCTECGQQLRSCPVCKVQCSVLRIFRP